MQSLLQKFGWARLLMLAAIALATLSQFYLAVGAHGTPYPISTNIGHGTIITSTAILNGTPAMSGWAAHPQAWLLLPLLAAAFYFDWDLGQWWMRLRYVVAVVALFVCTAPLERSPTPEDDGMGMTYALLAWATAIAAAIVAWRSRRAAPAVAL